MAGRIRTVKPEWLEDDKMLEATPAARVLSVAMILLADDYGRGRGKRARVVSKVFPEHPREGAKAFDELMALGFFSVYEIRDQRYFQITNWSRHQKVDKPGKPRVPCRCGSLDKEHECLENFLESPAKVSESLAPDHDHDHIPDHDHSEPQSDSRAFDLESIYASYPRKQGKKAGMESLRKKLKTQKDYDTLQQAVEQMSKIWRSCTKEQLSYCPYWSTFVSKELWRDEQLPAPSAASQSKQASKSPGSVDSGHYQDLSAQ